ncbi:MAG: hypothetical protein IKC66_00625 [Alistipes sp.]|nr:hypothetical protein [Alistipes sp.]
MFTPKTQQSHQKKAAIVAACENYPIGGMLPEEGSYFLWLDLVVEQEVLSVVLQQPVPGFLVSAVVVFLSSFVCLSIT